MKRLLNFIVIVFLSAIPIAGECETLAYSPSISGQPLIFHTNTAFQPSQYSAVTWTQLENALLIQSSYSQHLRNASNQNCCCQWDIWADGVGQWLQQNAGNHDQISYNDATGGITIGADTCCNDFVVGMAASYTHSNLRWKQSAGDSQINSYYGGLYGSWNSGCFYVNASVLAAYSDYHASRHFHFRRIDHHAHGRHKSWEALTGIEAGVLLQDLFCCIDLIPFVGVDYVYLSQQGYSERGADRFNLKVNKRNDQLLQSELGLQFKRRVLFCNSWVFAPNLSLSYINQTSLSGSTYHFNFVGRSNDVSARGWNFHRNLGAVALSFDFLNCTETLDFTLHYEGQFGKKYWNQTAGIMGNLCF